MVQDCETNFLYLSPLLKTKYPAFYNHLIEVINRNEIRYDFLENTKDVWCVDYMPIQIKENYFIQFTYNPSYLRFKKYEKIITNTDEVIKRLKYNVCKSEIIIDGGNIIKWNDKAIVTDRIFKDNVIKSDSELYNELKNILEIERLIVIPELPNDFTGHADGMVRWIDGNTVLINDFSKCTKKQFYTSFKSALINAGLNLIELPNETWKNSSNNDVTGDYINFLQMKDIIVVPSFGIKLDNVVVKILKDCFSNNIDLRIETVRANDIAKDSGLLNCISWNVRLD